MDCTAIENIIEDLKDLSSELQEEIAELDEDEDYMKIRQMNEQNDLIWDAIQKLDRALMI